MQNSVDPTGTVSGVEGTRERRQLDPDGRGAMLARGFVADDPIMTVVEAAGQHHLDDHVRSDARSVPLTFARTMATIGTSHGYCADADSAPVVCPERTELSETSR